MFAYLDAKTLSTLKAKERMDRVYFKCKKSSLLCLTSNRNVFTSTRQVQTVAAPTPVSRAAADVTGDTGNTQTSWLMHGPPKGRLFLNHWKSCLSRGVRTRLEHEKEANVILHPGIKITLNCGSSKVPLWGIERKLGPGTNEQPRWWTEVVNNRAV